jgi:hypothetical protein
MGWDQTTSAPEEYMACGHNRYAALNHNILHKALASQNPLRHQHHPLMAGSNPPSWF